ncbi:Mom family adenine methylcarbamoylation protein [[Kitasatospora] papulosa]|uniref:Mom family adenine methylcarbamoylation protein n=1 Tax=[Kitasatospora] papulosa TaxID=1464011 RepID=UPI0036A18F7C
MIAAYQQALPLTELTEVATASDWCRRWTHRTPSWRRVRDGGFDSRRYSVAPITETVAKAFVIGHHYTGSYPSASHRLGLFHDRGVGLELVGVAVFGTPAGAHVLSATFPELDPSRSSLVCSRFVLTDACPGNSESWFLARCHEVLYAHAVRGVLSFADPVPRLDAHGNTVAVGHVGHIYKVTNALYTGRTSPRTLRLLRDGTVFHERSVHKVVHQDQGHRYAEEQLIALGAAVPRAGEDMRAWLASALEAAGVRRLRHRGNHRWVFILGRNRRERAEVRLGRPVLPVTPQQPDAAAYLR